MWGQRELLSQGWGLPAGVGGCHEEWVAPILSVTKVPGLSPLCMAGSVPERAPRPATGGSPAALPSRLPAGERCSSPRPTPGSVLPSPQQDGLVQGHLPKVTWRGPADSRKVGRSGQEGAGGHTAVVGLPWAECAEVPRTFRAGLARRSPRGSRGKREEGTSGDRNSAHNCLTEPRSPGSRRPCTSSTAPQAAAGLTSCPSARRGGGSPSWRLHPGPPPPPTGDLCSLWGP